eukprot:2807494-Amphidinium_carterae.2
MNRARSGDLTSDYSDNQSAYAGSVGGSTRRSPGSMAAGYAKRICCSLMDARNKCLKLFCALCHWHLMSKLNLIKLVMSFRLSISGESFVDAWRRKCPLQALLNGEKDGRSVQGIKSRISELASKEKIHPDLPGLNNYLVLAKGAWELKEKTITSWKDSELAKILELLDEEGVEYPMDIQTKLVARRSLLLDEKRDYANLLAVSSPFQSATWSSSTPMVGCLTCTFHEKFQTFVSNIFTKVMQDMIKEGESWTPELIKYCDLIIEFLKTTADPVDCNLDFEQTSKRNECIQVCSAMKAILSDDVDLDALDIGQR